MLLGAISRRIDAAHSAQQTSALEVAGEKINQASSSAIGYGDMSCLVSGGRTQVEAHLYGHDGGLEFPFSAGMRRLEYAYAHPLLAPLRAMMTETSVGR